MKCLWEKIIRNNRTLESYGLYYRQRYSVASDDSEVRWLSRVKMIQRAFELWVEIATLLNENQH